ncbi:MAG: hypothetical protein VW268_04020 [Rhodospirillaceae bacterium]
MFWPAAGVGLIAGLAAAIGLRALDGPAAPAADKPGGVAETVFPARDPGMLGTQLDNAPKTRSAPPRNMPRSRTGQSQNSSPT